MNSSAEYLGLITMHQTGLGRNCEPYSFRIDERTFAEGVDSCKNTLSISRQDTSSKNSPKPCILIVDDDKDAISFLEGVFGRGFVVESSRFLTGMVAAEARKLDAIVIGMDKSFVEGIQLLTHLKQHPRTSHIPVVLMTKKERSEIRLECFKAGADDFLTGPSLAEELLVRVNNLINQRRVLMEQIHKKLGAAPAREEDCSQEERFLQRVNGLVEQNIGNPRFSVVQLADQMNLSRAQLFRKLKRFAGISPNQLINDKRLQLAADLIAMNADTLTQIGYRVGFNEHSYFAKRFKEKFGSTPSEYAEANRKITSFKIEN